MKRSRILYFLLVVYYLFLFIIETPLLLNVGIPSLTTRIIYLVLVIVPILLYDELYLPIVLFASYSISKFGTAVTLMPTELWYYAPIIVLIALLFRVLKQGSMRIPLSVIYLCISVLLIDLITSFTVNNIFYCFLILIFLFFYCSPKLDEELYFVVFSHMFIVIAIVLSLELLFAGDQYIQSYGNTDMERVMWADPNYLGGIIGMGVIAAAILLFRKNPLYLSAYLALVLLLMIAALIRNASRGALLAAISGVLVLLLGGRIKTGYKILSIVIAIIFVVYLLNNSYFDLLEYRLENDAGGGSGRTGIWLNKWNAYIQDSSALQLLFGVGYENGFTVGYTYNRAFHNDFLAFLVDYGLVGLIAFVSMFLYPLKGIFLKDKAVLACTVFLFVNCMTLEPFCLGVLLYYSFWLYTYFQAVRYNKSKITSVPTRQHNNTNLLLEI